ncbi:ubiquitin carboxyl-terminal hydrolase 35 isoform X2 [Chrysoperla carnea]|nr:ubiquitin carboxyl-terminal hydrolase 35 isoform X2 [Chrysoperla carnea]
MAVKQKVVESLGPKGPNNHYTLDELQNIIQYLNLIRSQPDIMPQSDELEKLCQNLVLRLGKFQMPKDISGISAFMNHVEEIKDFLNQVYETAPTVMRVTMLSAVYKSISESQGDAGPGLAVVLQLIDTNFITDAVRWILGPKHDDFSLVRGLNVLVGWLFQWTRQPQLGKWVVAFMNGLRAQGRYRVLEQVAVERIKNMIPMLRLPVYRSSVSTVLFHMLCSMQHSPSIFLIAAEQFPPIIEALRKENSECSMQCLQSIVDVCTALMDHFPNYENHYENLRIALQDEKPSEHYRNLLNIPSWSNGTELELAVHNVPGKVGLINLGNTCYMNSVLQALFMTQSFRNDILVCPYIIRPIEGLQSLFALLQFSKRSAVQPPDALLSIRPPGFLPGLQHDSSEYMGYLLDTLHEQEKPQHAARFNSNEGAQSASLTIVQRTFGGQAITTYSCNTCGGESVQTDPFRDIQLSFPVNASRDNSVQALLEFYLEPEQLCGENRYWCDRCGALSNAERILRVTQCPKHLILTLKHFRYDPKSQQRAKLFQRVCYDPVITLNTSRYDLYAAVVHSGPSVDSGHYYTYARDNLGIWYKFNDSFVSRTSMDELSSLQQPSTPYVLFYQKQDVAQSQPILFESLGNTLQAVVNRDLTAYAAESRNRIQQSPSPILRKHDDDDEPPSSCGGSGDFNSNNSNRFVY